MSYRFEKSVPYVGSRNVIVSRRLFYAEIIHHAFARLFASRPGRTERINVFGVSRSPKPHRIADGFIFKDVCNVVGSVNKRSVFIFYVGRAYLNKKIALYKRRGAVRFELHRITYAERVVSFGNLGEVFAFHVGTENYISLNRLSVGNKFRRNDVAFFRMV